MCLAQGPQRSDAYAAQKLDFRIIKRKKDILYKTVGINFRITYGPGCEKTCLQAIANIIGTDQPAHPRRPIRAFIISFLETIICKLAFKRNFNFLASLCS